MIKNKIWTCHGGAFVYARGTGGAEGSRASKVKCEYHIIYKINKKLKYLLINEVMME